MFMAAGSNGNRQRFLLGISAPRNALNLELLSAEAARPIERPDVLDYILRARTAWHRPSSPERYMEVISLYERALALDPRSIEAQSGLARNLASRVADHMTDTAAADMARAEYLVSQALATAVSCSFGSNKKRIVTPRAAALGGLDRLTVDDAPPTGWVHGPLPHAPAAATQN
jgi:hypothetical protein